MTLDSQSFPGGSDSKESACSVGDLGSVPRSGRSPGESCDNPPHHSCLEASVDEEPGGLSPRGSKELDEI